MDGINIQDHKKRSPIFHVAVVVASVLAALFLVCQPGNAQYFGKNKVHVKSHEWRVIESPHIHLHFYLEEREVAEEAILMAERAYTRLSRIYQHEMQNPIPLLIYSSHKEFAETRAATGIIGEGTGGMTELMKRRVIVPFTGSYAELDYVLIHELSHAFQVDILSRPGFGNRVGPLNWAPPLWTMEGISEYIATTGIGPRTDMWTRDGIIEGTLLDVNILSRVGDIRVYRFGQSLVAHIARNFGDEAIGHWFRSMARSQSFTRGTEESIGLTIEALSEEWADSLRARHLPEIIKFDKVTNIARRVTRHDRSLASLHIAPAVSPRGEEVVFISNETLYTDLYIASAIDGSHRKRIIRGQRSEDFETLRFLNSSFNWHPEGDRIVLTTRNDGNEVLVVFNTTSGEVEAEYSFDMDELLSPVWSPDGNYLYFTGLHLGRNDLYRITADGDSLRKLTDDRWANFQSAVSPDGGRVAFMTDKGYDSSRRLHAYAPWKLSMLDVDSGQVELLPDQYGINTNPQWFPDGRYLMFLSTRSGINNIFVRDMETGSDYQLTNLIRGVSSITLHGPSLTLSADGRRVVFSVFVNGGWDLFSIQDPLSLLDPDVPWQPPVNETLPILAESQPSPVPAAPQRADVVITPPLTPVTSETGDTTLVAVVRDYSPRTEPESDPDQPEIDWQTDPGTTQGETDVEVIPGPATDDFSAEFNGKRGHRENRWPDVNLDDIFSETWELPDSITCIERPYKPQLSIDIAQAAGAYASGFGLQAQTALLFSDMLGEKVLQVAADVNGAIDEGSYLLGYTDFGSNPAFNTSLYQYWTGYGYSLMPGYVEQYGRSLIRGFGASWIKPISRYRRLQIGLDLIYEKRYIYTEPNAWDPWYSEWDVKKVGAYYTKPGIAYIYDSAIYGMTGPIGGRRTHLSAYATFGERESAGLLLDHRLYYNIHQRYAFVIRSVYTGEWGKDHRSSIVGGPYSMRGFTNDPLYGPNIAFANFEFRFPFIDAFYIAWPLQLAFGGIRGALYCDLGAAWDDPREFRVTSCVEGHDCAFDDLKASFGFRASINLGMMILRWDLTRRSKGTYWDGKAKGEVSIGVEF
jgi:Tol biopolymer transport system component